ncbi:MAG TPA: VCBS repeat-containing protein, partial [Oceanospirillales bacterium]|nr:VCBS repeat-containing protein [Oceanospirillales bacterium]
MNKRQKLLLKWSLAFLGSVLLLLGMIYFTELGKKDPAALNDDGSVEGLTSVLQRQADSTMQTFQFREVAKQAGLNFKHFPAQRQSLLPEDMGSGMAWGDFDNDGLVDLFLVNFKGNINDKNANGQHALFKNQGDGTFVNVTKKVGLDKSSYGMAAAWGDFDNDNDLDLYISNYGANQLYRNDGKKGFVDISAKAGVDNTGFGAGVTWGDFNRDGLIDLYVCNYVKFINDEHQNQ